VRTVLRLRWTAVVLVGLLWLVGMAQTAVAPASDPPTDGVTLRGRVTFHGPAPKAQRLRVVRDSEFCGTTMLDEAMLLDPKLRGVAGVVVSLEGVVTGKLVAENGEVVIDNKQCRFMPRVQAAMAGGMLALGNADPILHNTHVRKDSRFGKTVLNVALPTGVRVVRKPLRETGLLDVRCAAHPFMHATIHVFDHPYFAFTDDAGAFEVTKVPPGTYRLRVWHETLGTREQSITIPSVGPVTVNLELGPEE